MEFIKGKWYRAEEWTHTNVARCSKSVNSEFNYDSFINSQNEYVIHNSHLLKNLEYKEVSISEIKHLLPKDYKFEQEMNYYFY